MADFADEIHSLVREKKGIAAKLTAAAGGADYSFLINDCEELADIIDEIEEVTSKRNEKERAAFETKVKFSRKVRRKAKDLNNFEQGLIKEYDSKHITLEHGKKMVSIIKLLRSMNVGKARREADEFYALIELSERLGSINETLAKRKAQIGKEKGAAEAQLSKLAALEAEPPIDSGKVARHNERETLDEQVTGRLARQLLLLQALPFCELLGRMQADNLGKAGFPGISGEDSRLMAEFLKKSGLASKTAEELYEMAGQNEQKLRHSGVDLAQFRQEVIARKSFLFSIVSLKLADLQKESFQEYLSSRDEDAKSAIERLSVLGKTRKDDDAEWAREIRINLLKSELASVGRNALQDQLEELSLLESIIDGKAEPVLGDETGKKAGIVEKILKFLGSG